MDPDIYGRFIFSFSLIKVISIISRFGMDTSLIYILTEKKKEKESLFKPIGQSVLIILSISGLVISVFLLLKTFGFLEDPKFSYFQQLILVSIVIALSDLLFGVFRFFKVLKPYVLIRYFAEGTLKIAAILLAFSLDIENNSPTIAIYLSTVIGFILLVVQVRRKIDLKWEKFSLDKQIMSLLNFSYPIAISNLLNIGIVRLEIFLIGFYSPDNEIGIYNIALLIGLQSNFLLQSINSVISPIVSENFLNNQIDEISRIHKLATRWVFYITLFLTLTIFLFAPQFLSIFGEEYKTAENILLIIFIAQLIKMSTGPVGYLNIMTNRAKYELWTNLIFITIKLLLLNWLIPWIGLIGAALALLISTSISRFLKAYLLYQNIKIPWISKKATLVYPFDDRFLWSSSLAYKSNR